MLAKMLFVEATSLFWALPVFPTAMRYYLTLEPALASATPSRV
jgi:hypothetical protein